ncbi:unnamed protein product [Echinostoma caproni]|uniref:Uncharacterized protein n=1 Tax=Echinostoma caproni TaxID=27848 RepID=A0A3P8L3N0_9TREM|nr:unnamed protein product [Echinostoma caproni]
MEATQKLKQAFTAERRARVAAETQLRELDTNKMSIRLVELAKDYQDAIGRAERAEKKLDEVQCALKARELEFKELQESRYTIDSPEVTKLITARTEAVEARHLQTIKNLQEKLDESTSRFVALEDEFRLALRIEAERYSELFNSSEALKTRTSELETANKDLQQREESARQLVTELTAAIKDQKSKAASQQKAHLLLQHNQKERIATLEKHLEEARTRLTNMENLKAEQKQLKAELAAQESLVAGLRAERRNWSEELAQQSTSFPIRFWTRAVILSENLL